MVRCSTIELATWLSGTGKGSAIHARLGRCADDCNIYCNADVSVDVCSRWGRHRQTVTELAVFDWLEQHLPARKDVDRHRP